MDEAVEVLGGLGHGSASDVVLARRHGPFGFSRLVVLKRLKPSHAGNPAYRADLVREARAYALLSHPTIVQLYDFIEHEGRPTLVLEYVNGFSLHALRTSLRARRETLGDEDAMYVMAQVFAALAAAHSARDPETGEFAGVTHRDVSPGNVLVARDGAIKLTDFGIAKLTGVEVDTALGLVKGTYPYMAPEQLLGGRVTSRTDVYSASLLLRELLIRRPNFARGSMSEPEFLDTIAHPRLPPLDALRTGVPAAVCDALRIALRPDSDARDITAVDLRDILGDCVDDARARGRLSALLAEVRPAPLDGADQSATTRPREESATASAGSTGPSSGSLSTLRPTLQATPRPKYRPPPTASSRWRGFLSSLGSDEPATRSLGLMGVSMIGLAALIGIGTIPVLRRILLRPSAVAAAPPLLSSSPALQAPAGPEAATPPLGKVPVEAPAPAATVGELVVTETPACPHRVFIDERVVGVTGDKLVLPCGRHRARVGSKGQLQWIAIPCGGSVSLDPRW